MKLISVVELIQRPKLKLRWKLLGGFLAVIFLLVIALGVALTSLFGTSSALADLKVSSERSRQVEQMLATETQMVNLVMDYLWSGNLSRLNDYNITKNNLDKTLTAFRPSAAQKETYNSLLTEIKTLYGGLDEMLALETEGRVEDTDKQIRQLWQTQTSRQAVRVRALLTELGRLQLEQANTEYNQTQNSNNQITGLVTGLAAITLLLAIGLAFLFTLAVTSPLAELSQRLLKLAGGDLTRKLEIRNRDELGEVAQTYNRTLLELRKLVQELHTQGQLVSTASQELVYQANSQVSGSSQQASAVIEANQTIRELDRTAEEITKKANAVADAVFTSLNQAHLVSTLADQMAITQQQGRSSVAQIIEQVNFLKGEIGTIEEEQKILLDQSRAIEKVIQVIDGFASQTHLLALNAGIEAAGAGMYGKRFAVIAAEIKRLADNSAQSTKEIRQALETISLGVARVAERTKQGLVSAQEAVNEAGQSDTKLVALTRQSEQVKNASRDILNEVERSAELAEDIRLATSQQQMANRQILTKMLEIEAVTTQTLSNIKQGEIISYRLKDSADKLKTSASAFTLEGV